MARPKQPIDLVEAMGKKHLTKDEIETRKATEVKADIDNIFAPLFLKTKKQKDKFDYIAAQLLNAKIISNLDVDSLGRYILLETQFEKITKHLNSTDILSENYDRLLARQSKVFTMLDKLSNSLCLNILSRCKVSVPKAEDKPKNKFAKFGAQNG